MGIFQAFEDSVASTFADQWKEIVTAGAFDEHTLVAPGVLKLRDKGRGTNDPGSEGVISNGSKIFVPENTAAVVLNQASIENVVTIPGGYEYLDGDESVLNGDGLIKPLTKQIGKRFGFGGITPDYKQIAFVNLREIRNIKFGTAGGQIYHDPAYGVDLELHVWGSFSIQITDADRFIKNFVPPRVTSYSIDDPNARYQVASDFLQSLSVALNSMSATYRVSQLISHENEITARIADDLENVRSWNARFGFRLLKAAISSIELSDSSKEIIRKYAAKKVEVDAYSSISQKASDIAAQQKIAQGIQDNGLGGMGGAIFGMNMAQNLGAAISTKPSSVDQQLETLKKLKEALDAGILTHEEFNAKKKEILGL